MKQFIVDRHTTPNTPTLEQVPTEKIPIYDTIEDVESDLSNLAEGQIVGTKDTDLVANLDPVDEVKDGVFKPVTSNAVAECLKYSSAETFTGKVYVDENGVEHKIYRKFYYSATNWANGTTIDTIANFGILFSLTNATVSNGGEWEQDTIDSSNYTNAAVNATTGAVRVFRGGVFANSKPSQVIIEYTKTTD